MTLSCIALLPMGFCYPGTGKSGDLPPRPECAARLARNNCSNACEKLQLTLVIGQYAHAYHLDAPKKSSLTAERAGLAQLLRPTLCRCRTRAPGTTSGCSRNPWFETELIPVLRQRVAEVLSS